MYENIEDDDHTNSNTFKYTSVKKVTHFDNDSINNNTTNYNGRHYLNMSDVQRKVTSLSSLSSFSSPLSSLSSFLASFEC